MPTWRNECWPNNSLAKQPKLQGTLTFVLCLLLSQAVFAQRKDRIIIAVAGTPPTTTRRLEAELRSLGFEVVLHTYPASTKVETGLIRLARDANALAVVGVSDHGESAEFFVVDLITD